MSGNLDRQIEREKQSVTSGIDRFRKQLKIDQEKGREFAAKPGSDVTTEIMNRFVPVVEQMQREAKVARVAFMTRGTAMQKWYDHLLVADAAAAAYITIRTCLSTTERLAQRLIIAKRIGRMLNLEVRWRALREAEAARDKAVTTPPYNRITYLVKAAGQASPKVVRKWLKKLNDIETVIWPERMCAEIGVALLARLLETCPDTFERHQYKSHRFGKWITQETVRLTEKARARLEATYKEFADERPWLMPMVCPPLYWQPEGEGWTGGYYELEKGRLFKKSHNEHTSEVLPDFGVPDVVLDATNMVQHTPWVVNMPVLLAAQHAAEHSIRAVLPVEPARELPDEVPADQWEAMSDEQKGIIRNMRRETHNHNFKLESKRLAFRRQRAVAHDLRDEPAIFFPHNLDFRGRLYPMPQDLHPQSDDFGRAALTFADAKPLGEEGYKWLCYHVANTYGMDKASRKEQLAWVEANWAGLFAVALTPFEAGLEFWAKAEAPWQFLAAATEYVNASLSGNAYAYRSRLPVHVDGSCNGLQHLSAMGLDPVGAFATNLTACPARQDIYEIVSEAVKRSIEADVASGIVEAAQWLGRVDRKVVKRGVMTVPYGLTSIGMRDQLMEDGWTQDMADPQRAANYLRDKMRAAIEETVTSASEIMKWMQGNAEILAKNNCPVRWVAPSGLVVQQAYYTPLEKRIYTVMGVGQHRQTRYHEQGVRLRVTKQISAVVPNIIHSFDAAHMMLTMAAVPTAAKLSVSAVHDSFGCHAADMPMFLGLIQDQFAGIYQHDWFAALQADFLASRGTLEFPLLAPPARRDFNIEEVRGAPFFFA
ncbi:MAG: DNA-directed RNA polymerase [Anaerolineales bacterium]